MESRRIRFLQITQRATERKTRKRRRILEQVGVPKATTRSSCERIVGINENKHKREINREDRGGFAFYNWDPTILLLVQFYSQNLKPHSSLN